MSPHIKSAILFAEATGGDHTKSLLDVLHRVRGCQLIVDFTRIGELGLNEFHAIGRLELTA